MGNEEILIKDLAGIEIKGLSEDGTFDGHGAIFGNIDSYGDIIEPGAFSRTLKNQKVFPLLWSHQTDSPIGKFTAKQDKEGLKIRGELNLDIPKAKEVYSNMKKGIVTGLSIGYRVVKDELATVAKRTVRKLKEIRLFEVSAVVFPANELAQVEAVKNIEKSLIDKDPANATPENDTIQIYKEFIKILQEEQKNV